ncbi:TonB-dependent receptor plug domain-containing protein [Glaciecola siphonariae]|uniref:TonB-dependent receptor plug domain-containing protein n=1 Tax=Glaciecola siphonariae TaxID=521012 RepID=A0ABV9LQG1_9ALTE
MNVKFSVIATLVATSFLSTSLLSQAAYAQDIEEIKVTGTRLSDEPVGALSVITRAEIEQINPASTIDLLRRVPHLDIAENGNAGGFSYVSVRGGEFNFTLVLIDGVAVNDSTNSRGGGFDFNQVNPSAIERVEVYRGGINTIYGGEAISGVINIITRKDTSPTLSLEVGTDEQLNASATGSTALASNISLLGSVSTQNKKVSAFEQVNSHQGLAKLSIDQKRASYSALVTYNNSDVKGFAEDSGGELFALPQTAEERDSEQWLISASGNWELSNTLELHGNVSWVNREETSEHPGIADGVFSGIPASDITSEYERAELDAYVDWQVQRDTLLVLGANLRQQDGKNRGFLDFGFPLPVDYDFSQDTQSAFVEAQHSFSNVTVEGSVRYDSPDDFDNETSFRLGASLDINDDTQVFAVFNQGYKLPSFFALAHPLVGNSELQPERSDNFEVGFKSAISKDLSFAIVYFANQFEDLVDFDAELFTNVNRNSVDTSGLEFDLQANINRFLRFSGNVRYLDIDAEQGVTLRKRPNVSGNLQLDINYEALTTSIFVDFRDDFLDSAIPTGYVVLGGYATVGVSASYDLNDHTMLTLNVENALGKNYQDAVGFIKDDAEARVGIRYQF